MGSLFCDDKVKSFFEILQRPVCSQEELVECTKQAFTCIAEKLHIGKVTSKLSAPRTTLRAPIDNLIRILYQGAGAVSDEPVTLEFKTGDGGDAAFQFFPLEGYVWDADELREIRIIGNQIYVVFSQSIMSGLLKHAMLMDLAVDIPNVSGFMEFAGRLFAQGRLQQYHGIYLNIHNFKYVNKVLPHIQGDEVMKLYANALVGATAEGEMVARLGGDNYVALVRGENAAAFIEFVRDINIRYRQEGKERQFSFGATIGAAQLEDLQNPADLMMRISIAYQVARQNGGGVVYYSDAIYKEVMQQKEIIARFEHAFNAQEFVVYYQPKITTADKKICGAEALVRWKKNGQIVAPVEFIPVLEKEGSICKLDFYVLDKVCAMLQRCKRENMPMPQISVNFSKRHVGNPELVKEIIAVIDKYDIPHKYLEIELTESEDFKDSVVMSKVISNLKSADIKTSIDDFGTGYSSLNMLKETKIDLLKIDKSFLPLEREYADKERDIIMFENITRLAKDLGIKTVAEGVETEQQYEYLTGAGCDMIQGYYFDKPLPEEEFLQRMSIGHY